MNKQTSLRSQSWFNTDNLKTFIHRSWLRIESLPDDVFDNRPVIGICNTWSELTPCNSHFRELADHVRKGVLEAGGTPFEFPVMSLGEPLMRPSTMMFRNLVSMDVEETIRANPLDGVVLLTGCDKTTPALLMGAASVDLPAIVVSGGPMLNGQWRGQKIGSGTHSYKFVDMVRTGQMTTTEYREVESCMARSHGHCMTMGTASTMASLVEALGASLPQNAAIPAADARRGRLARESGRRIVEMVRDDLTLSRILTRAAFENAIRTLAAIGGSTNGVIHLLALAGRVGVPLQLSDFDSLTRSIPLLVNLMPSGEHLMEDFFYAGGLPAVLHRLGDLIDRSAMTVSGKTMGEQVAEAPCWDGNVIRDLSNPFKTVGGVAILKGNLATGGAVIKPSAATPELMRHTGRAVVFDGIADFDRRINSDELEVDENSVLVLRGCGPRGYPGMPEVGNMPLPQRLLQRGIRDLVRISDARMSGTAFGTVVLHASPEGAAGGPIALVRTGDLIELDVEKRRLWLNVEEAELERRKAEWTPPPPKPSGYARLYVEHVLQADEGADFDFLRGCRGAAIPYAAYATATRPME